MRVTHEWVERSASAPPAAPPAAVFPPDGGETDGTDIAFRWVAPPDPDGDAIVNYHFELSDRPDMRWPLSTNFSKLISKTADRGNARYTLPYVGLLAPDRPCYWRVRAKDEKGLWGPWSGTWSFTPRGPAPPPGVALDSDPDQGVGTLRWKANPEGRRPVKYRVYGSDEKGFSISDEPYRVNVGSGETGGLSSPFPANFVAETSETQMVVVGAGLERPNANKAFYRVVAVDEQGERSWSSDFATAPRPFIYTTPVLAAKVGEDYRYRVSAIRSLGDLTAREKLAMDFWDVEQPRFTLEKGPGWLKADERTGLLSGTPNAPGRAEVTVAVTLEREVRHLNPGRLIWGQIEVTGTGTERLGPATQRFVIEVSE